MKDQFNYPLWLHSLDGIGNKKIQILLNTFKCAKNVYWAREQQLKEIKGLTQKDRAAILYRRNKDEILKKQDDLFRKNILFLSAEDEKFPDKLRNINDSPYGIYVKGTLPQKEELIVAMVGARMCTPYGKYVAEELAYALSLSGVSVISGMARGIDAFSHKGCLKGGGKTYAVLAGGVDVIYPPEHGMLYENIIESGAVISEYPPGEQPQKGMFPQRNRLISALANQVVVVEAKERSGSLITADFALEQGKDIYVVPGRINDALSAGCNSYIKQGADIIESIPKFLEQLNLSASSYNGEKTAKKVFLEKEESIVYSCLRLTPCSVQDLIFESKLDLMCVMRALNRLEEMGLAEEYYKNYYIRSN